jgi:hypothetical protein
MARLALPVSVCLAVCLIPLRIPAQSREAEESSMTPTAPPRAAAARFEAGAVGRETLAPRFGERGQFVVMANLAVSGMVATVVVDGGSTAYRFPLSLGVDYFVLRNLSIGGSVTGEYDLERGDGYRMDAIRLGAAARIGYNISLSDRVSLWPRLALGVDYGIYRTASVSDTGSRSLSLMPEFYLPVIIEVAPHFYCGNGPYVDFEIFKSDALGLSRINAFTVGFETMFGCYF